jgi:hypothetical protein
MNAIVTATNEYHETITARRYTDDTTGTATWTAHITGRHRNPIASNINTTGNDLINWATRYDFDLEGMVG